MNITYTQCKQLDKNVGGYLREAVAVLKDQPPWITRELELSDIKAIQQGGCASGAYMPAVGYYSASQTMYRHGDDVMEYILHSTGCIADTLIDKSWSEMAVYHLSLAVELWCSQFDLDGVEC